MLELFARVLRLVYHDVYAPGAASPVVQEVALHIALKRSANDDCVCLHTKLRKLLQCMRLVSNPVPSDNWCRWHRQLRQNSRKGSHAVSLSWDITLTNY